MDEQNKDYMEAFDELAKAYEDDSRSEPSFDDLNSISEPEDPSEDTDTFENVPEEDVFVEPSSEESQTSTVENSEPAQELPAELPLDYKELYEKAKRDADAQNKLWASRLNTLSAQYTELKEQVNSTPKEVEPDPELKELFEYHPEIAKAVQSLVDSKVKAVKQEVEPLKQQMIQTEANTHLSTIYKVHPDVMAILDSGDLVKWINELPPVMRNGAQYVYQYGSAEEVISMLNDYKAARVSSMKSAPAANPAKAAPVAQTNPESTEDIVKQVLAAMAVRTSKEQIDINKKPARKVKEKSFDDFAREYERDRRVR